MVRILKKFKKYFSKSESSKNTQSELTSYLKLGNYYTEHLLDQTNSLLFENTDSLSEAAKHAHEASHKLANIYLDSAISAYKEVLALDSTNQEALDGIKQAKENHEIAIGKKKVHPKLKMNWNSRKDLEKMMEGIRL